MGDSRLCFLEKMSAQMTVAIVQNILAFDANVIMLLRN